MSSAALNADNLKQPKAIVRYVEILITMLAFALIVDYAYWNHWTPSEAFGVANILAFIWCIIWVIIYLISRLFMGAIKIVNIIEFAGDIFFAIFLFAVGIALPAKLHDPPAQIVFGIIFNWVAFILFCVSCFLDFKSITSSTAAQTADAAA